MKAILACLVLCLIGFTQGMYNTGPGCSSSAAITRRDNDGMWQDELGRLNSVYDVSITITGACRVRYVGVTITLPKGFEYVQTWNLEFDTLFTMIKGFEGYLQPGQVYTGAGFVAAKNVTLPGTPTITIYGSACDEECIIANRDGSASSESSSAPVTSSESTSHASSSESSEEPCDDDSTSSNEGSASASASDVASGSTETPSGSTSSSDSTSESASGSASASASASASSSWSESASASASSSSSSESASASASASDSTSSEAAVPCGVSATITKDTNVAPWTDAQGRTNAVYKVSVTNGGSCAATAIHLSFTTDGEITSTKWNLSDDYFLTNFGGSLAAGGSYDGAGLIAADATTISVTVFETTCSGCSA